MAKICHFLTFSHHVIFVSVLSSPKTSSFLPGMRRKLCPKRAQNFEAVFRSEMIIIINRLANTSPLSRWSLRKKGMWTNRLGRTVDSRGTHTQIHVTSVTNCWKVCWKITQRFSPNVNVSESNVSVTLARFLFIACHVAEYTVDLSSQKDGMSSAWVSN
jgi:hypothetical protein